MTGEKRRMMMIGILPDSFSPPLYEIQNARMGEEKALAAAGAKRAERLADKRAFSERRRVTWP